MSPKADRLRALKSTERDRDLAVGKALGLAMFDVIFEGTDYRVGRR